MKFETVTAGALAAGLSLMIVASTALAADDFQGVWRVKDSAGKTFEITLTKDGRADASIHGMTGSWKKEGKAAVINWNTGWTTKITKEDDHYRHEAYRKGQSVDGSPANSSDAKKLGGVP